MIDPTVKAFGDSIVAVWPTGNVILEFSRLQEHRDTLSAELHVTNHAGSLHWSRVNLASAGGRTSVVKALEDAQSDLPWRQMLDRSCQLVARHLRTAEPAVPLVATKPDAEQWLVVPWIPLHQTTVLYGTGGSAKSLLALALAVAGLVRHTLGGPWVVGPVRRVLYLDWEATRHVHEGRLWGLTRAYECPASDALLYRRLRRPLVDVIADVRTEAERGGVDFTILDSMAPASGPEPESAQAAVPTLQALDSLPGTKLALAHVSKAASEQPQAKPFGSIMVENLARSTIEVRRQESVGQTNETTISLYHRKTNNGPLASATGVSIFFGDDGGIAMRQTTPEPGSDNLAARILAVLRDGARSGTAVAESLGEKPDSVRKILGRLEARDRVVRLVPGSGGKGKDTQWGLPVTTRDMDA